jgi:hypothetical protein
LWIPIPRFSSFLMFVVWFLFTPLLNNLWISWIFTQPLQTSWVHNINNIIRFRYKGIVTLH